MQYKQFEIVKASAGSGKTTELVGRIIFLLNQGVKPTSILATTFTKKAASEIKERVFSIVAKSATDKEFKDKIIKQYSLTNYQPLEILNGLIENLDSLSFFTLDSFFSQIAKSFVNEIGLALNWEILSEKDNIKLKKEILNTIFTELGVENIKFLFESINSGLKDRQVFDSFSKLMSAEYTDTFLRLKNPDTCSIKVENEDLNQLYELFFLKLKELDNIEIPLNKDKTVPIHWEKEIERIKNLPKNFHYKSYLEKGLPYKVLTNDFNYSRKPITENTARIIAVLNLLAIDIAKINLKNQTKTFKDFSQINHILGSKFKLETGSYSFYDIKYFINNFVKKDLLNEIFYRLGVKYEHILFDEFQDTSLIEWSIIKNFLEDILDNDNASCFCVGDVKQSIYGWRGGNPEIFNNIENKYQIFGKAREKDFTYRCSKEVVNFVNLVFKNLGTSLKEKQGIAFKNWKNNFKEHITHNQELGYVKYQEIDSDQDLEVFLKIYQDIITIDKKYPNHKIGILVHTNKYLKDLSLFLKSKGLSVSEEGKKSIDDYLSICLLKSILKVIDNDLDSLAVWHLESVKLYQLFDLKNVSQLREYFRRYYYKNGFIKFFSLLVSKLKDKITLIELEILDRVKISFFNTNVHLESITDILNKIDNLSFEDPGSSNISIMTIHSSKGLEFDTVFLPQMSKAYYMSNSFRNFLADFDPDDNVNELFFGASQLMEEFIPQIEKLSTKKEIDLMIEALSVIYVALTRAKLNLFIYSNKKKSNQNNFIKGLKLIVSDKYEQGEFTHINEVKNIKEFNLEIKDLTLIKSSFVRGSLGDSGKGEINTEYLFNLNNQSSLKGEVIHLFFESIDWILEYKFNKDFLIDLVKAKNLSIDDQDLAKIIKSFKYYLNKDFIKELFIKRSENISLFKEKRFLIEKDAKVITGIIDRLEIEKDENQVIKNIRIIDFKSDYYDKTINRELWLETKIENYRLQMENYKYAMSKLFDISLDKINCYLVFLNLEETVLFK